ncbi:MFS transporter [Aliidongia dinghuensis]|uniref:MFS transporter n=1 Tax=Aliidongia dinghuensis TaxID=1867774 RepID=A0A8J3E7D5_9PROT|nr:MFS transporter [Aliidongia dinghuensis]GGF38683.1 MFS transporter [Aliidongia dinghuensis]
MSSALDVQRPVPARVPRRLSAGQAIAMMLGMVLVGLNLRPALSGVAPILTEIRGQLGLSTAFGGLLTTAPVLCLGLFGPLAPRLARRFGIERTIFAVMILLALGTALRSLGGAALLFLGEIIAGASIGIIGVLLPGLVKRDFPDRMGLATGAYTMALCFGAAAAAGLTAPAEHWLANLGFAGGWRPALAVWAVPVLAAALAWSPQLARAGRLPPAPVRPPVKGLWRTPLAWQVTLFMGLQSSLSYCVFGWLAPILQDRGLTPVESGLVVSVSALVQVVSAMAAPMLTDKGPDQRWMVVVTLGLVITGLMGAVAAPLSTLWLWAVVLGLGQGSVFAVALMLIVLRTGDPETAAALSGMAQSVGYTLAAMGPFAAGLIKAVTGSWDAVQLLFLVLTAAALAAGLGAGRNRAIELGRR